MAEEQREPTEVKSSLGWSVAQLQRVHESEDGWMMAQSIAESNVRSLAARGDQRRQRRKKQREPTEAAGGAAAVGFAKDMFRRTESARVDARLLVDYQAILDGHCKYLPHLLAGGSDWTICERLANDLEERARAGKTGSSMVEWSKHLKYEDPSFSRTFNEIVGRMAAFFDVEVHATRLNFYRDGSDWNPFHHDSHAFGANGVKEDFTMGVSFGESRSLAFLHEPSASQFALPQHNGDVFAFTSVANKRFKHGVPRGRASIGGSGGGCRFSIIAWGRRNAITRDNAGADEPLGPNARSGIPPYPGSRPPFPLHAAGRRREASGHTATAPPELLQAPPETSCPLVLKHAGAPARSNVRVDVSPVQLVAALVKKKRRAACAELRRATHTTAALESSSGDSSVNGHMQVKEGERGKHRQHRRRQQQKKNSQSLLLQEEHGS